MTYSNQHAVYLDEYSDDDLIEELHGRGFKVFDVKNKPADDGVVVDMELLNIFEKMRSNQPYDQLLRELIYQRTGRIA